MVALQKADTNLDEVVNDVNNLVNCTHCHGPNFLSFFLLFFLSVLYMCVGVSFFFSFFFFSFFFFFSSSSYFTLDI